LEPFLKKNCGNSLCGLRFWQRERETWRILESISSRKFCWNRDGLLFFLWIVAWTSSLALEKLFNFAIVLSTSLYLCGDTTILTFFFFFFIRHGTRVSANWASSSDCSLFSTSSTSCKWLRKTKMWREESGCNDCRQELICCSREKALRNSSSSSSSRRRSCRFRQDYHQHGYIHHQRGANWWERGDDLWSSGRTKGKTFDRGCWSLLQLEFVLVLMFSMDYPSRWERERESNFCNFSLSEHNLCTFSLSIIYATSFLWAQSMHLLSANLFGNCLKSGPSLLNNLGFHSETVRMILCSWATIHCNNPGTLADCWHIALLCLL